MSIKKNFLEILVCPKCRGQVELNENLEIIVCYKCNLTYKIKDDIPIMLIENAKHF